MEDHPLNCLPPEITLNIFSRLPVESVLDCRLVCKPWRNLLQFDENTYFANLHLKRQQDGSEYIHVQRDGNIGSAMTIILYNYVIKHRADDEKPYHIRRRINLKFPEDTLRIVGSCNGLICLSAEKRNYKCINVIHRSSFSTQYYDETSRCHYTDEPLYVCNPITREYVNLPELPTDKRTSSAYAYIVHGFGYHPLTNEYKVIRIFYPLHGIELPRTGHAEVYTLGSGNGWRSAGDVNYGIDFFNRNFRSVCVNGAFYWFCNHEGTCKIVAFDLADEKFHWIPFPHGMMECLELSDMRGCLCLLHKSNNQVADLWLYTADDEGETSSYHTKEHYTKNNKSWYLSGCKRL